MKVIAALNGLITSEVAALYALHYASFSGFSLVLLHILNPEDSHADVEKSMAVIEKEASAVRCDTERLFLSGDPVVAIKTFLQGTRADILFCGTRLQRRFFENSFSERLTNLSLPVDLAVVRAVHLDRAVSFNSILLPILGDRLSVSKFVFFAALCRAYDASGEIYSVTVESRRRMAAMNIAVTRDLLQKINDRLSHYQKISRVMGLQLRIRHAVTDNEIKQILHHLSSHEFKLMVIGGQRLGLGFQLFGEKPIERLFRSTSINTIAFYEGIRA